MRVTPREQEVLQLLNHRYTNKQIAKVMGISTYTVRDHVSSLLHKAGKRHRAELVEAASRV